MPLQSDARRPLDSRQFRWLAAVVLLVLVVPRLAQRGMFLDGVTYAVVARNLAAGQGTFRQPSFSDTIYRTFHEQPPLGMALQSLAFQLLGDHFYVERLFSVLTFGLTGLLIALVWRRWLPGAYDWLPLFFWALPSVVTWAAVNNMLENTQALFTTAAVLCLLRASGTTHVSVAAGWTAGAAAAVVAAVLVKGPVGLFPLAVPPLLRLARADAVKGARLGLIWIVLAALVTAAAMALYVSEPARYALSEFGRTHLMPALGGDRGLPKRSSDIARHLTLGIWARMAGLLLLLWVVRRRITARGIDSRAALFFFLVGVIASVPILVSPVLAGHYFLPSVPWFALASATLALPTIQTFRAPAGRGRLAPAGVAIGLAAIAALFVLVRGPMEPRDRNLIAGLDAIRTAAPVGATVGTCANAAAEFGLQSYLQRFYRISVDPSGSPVNGWFIVLRSGCAARQDCAANAGDATLRLYRCDGHR